MARALAILLLVGSALGPSRAARADETTVHPVVRLGWSTAESLVVTGGIGTAWPRETTADRHLRLAAGADIGLGGASVFLEGGVCQTAPHLLWCALDGALGVRVIRTFGFSSWPTAATYGGIEAGGRFLLLTLRVGLFRRLAEESDTRALFFAGVGFP